MFLRSVRRDDQDFVDFSVRKLIVGFFLNLLRESVLFGCRNAHHFFVEMKERVDWKNAKPKLRYTLADGTEINPNIRTNNYDQDGEGGSAPRGRNFRDSLNGGHFYLSCAKIGKVDHVTNYDPFVDFYPSVRLVDGFVAKGKITPDTWLFYRDKLTLNFHTAFETIKAKLQEAFPSSKSK